MTLRSLHRECGLWKNRVNNNVGRQDVFTRNYVARGSSRNVDMAASNPQQNGVLFRRLLRKVNADVEFNELGLARRLHVGM